MAKADLHLHSRVSDGLPTVADLLAYVEHRTDLDVVAVTDHEDARGGQLARELAARRGYRVDVIVGAEVTTWQGHVLALFIEEAPPSFRSIEATLEAIHAAGGLAVIPHPLSWLTRSLSRRTIDRVVARGEPGVGFDAVELCNPSPAGRATARRAIKENAHWRLPATGSSDAHHLLHVGTGWTEFAGQSTADLRRALAAGAIQARMVAYPSLREIGYGRAALGLLWGYAATPRKMLTLGRRTRKVAT